MLDGAGFAIDARIGDYTGALWSDASPRTILFASRR
jgi:hypothetical protein